VATFNDLPNYNAFSDAQGPMDWMMRMLEMGDRKEDWMMRMLEMGDRKEKDRKLGIQFSVWWQLWMERNCIVFEAKECSVPTILGFVQDQLHRLHLS
jgi:hypothetical protein